MSLWLSEEELKEFTGIYTGRRDNNGRLIRHHQLQAEFLRERGIPFHQNIRGRCLVARQLILGGKTQTPTKPKWQPKPLRESA